MDVKVCLSISFVFGLNTTLNANQLKFNYGKYIR